MSVFSKIFIVINLLLSLLLVGVMGTLLSQKADYRSSYESAHGDLRALLAERRELDRAFKASLVTLGGENQRTAAVLASRTAEQQRSAQLRMRQEQSINSARKRRGKLQTSIRKTDKAFAGLTGEVRDLIEQLDRARQGRTREVAREMVARNSLQGRTARLADERSNLALLQRSQTQLGELRRRAIHLVRQAKKKGIKIPTITYPKLHGVIERLVPQTQLVIISLGSNDRVRKGMGFRVSRGADYIGMIQVTAVYPNMATARAQSNRFRPPPRIRKGDEILSSSGGASWK